MEVGLSNSCASAGIPLLSLPGPLQARQRGSRIEARIQRLLDMGWVGEANSRN